jgi:hypothetical protein
MTARIALAGALESMGRFAEAETMLREAMSLGRETPGESNALTFHAIGKLAGVLVALERYPEAQELYEEARTGFLSQSGADAVPTLSATLGLGVALKSQGRFDEASRWYADVLERARRVCGETNRFTFQVRNRIGELEVAQEKLDAWFKWGSLDPFPRI